MSPSNDLYQIVASLSKAEKGYLKKYAYKGKDVKDSIYLQALDKIDRLLQSKDETATEKWLTGFAKEKSKSVSSIKNYLIDLILNAMIDYHKGKDKEEEIFNLLKKADILKQKGLIDIARKINRKAIKKSGEYDLFELNLLLLKQNFNLYQGNTSNKTLYQTFFQSFREETTSSIFAYYSGGFLDLFTELNDYARKYNSIQNEKDYQYFKNKLENSGIKEHKNSKSSRVRKMRLAILGNFYYLISDYKALSRNYFEMSLESEATLTKGEYLFAKLNNTYFNVLQYAALNCDFEMADQFLQKLSLLKTKNSKDEEKQKLLILYGRLIINQQKFDFEENLKIISIYKDLLKDDKPFVSNIWYGVFWRIIHTLFLLEDYNQLIEWLNIFHIRSEKGLNQQYQSAFRLTELFAYYELNEMNIFEHRIRSYERFLKSKKEQNPFETEAIQIFKKLDKTLSASEMKQFFKEKLKTLEQLENNHLQSTFLYYFDLIAYLKSKIFNKTYRIEYVIREKEEREKENIYELDASFKV